MAGPYDWRQLGTRTDIRWKSARELGRLALDAGMQIGLHSSARACERNSYRVEKDRIEQTLNVKLKAHRSHYLRFNPLTLGAQLQSAAIEYDFSLGCPYGMGVGDKYTYACNSPDVEQHGHVLFIPLLFMDTAFAGGNRKVYHSGNHKVYHPEAVETVD